VEQRYYWAVHDVSAAILAGGRARRLGGADKASLIVGGVRIIEHQLAALAPVADDIRIVAGNPSRYAGLQVPVIADAIDGAGPLGGLFTALSDARHEWVVVLACDLPFLSAALLERLVAEIRPALSHVEGTGEQIDAVVPRSARGLEPLCAVYRRGCAAAARARIDRGDLAVVGLLTDLRVRELGPHALAPYDDGTLFENVNTPHDYARARERVGANGKPSENRITE
jgi:molybdopterin-guanine dinucleotide biosynthesis protein A